jgi:hypothetical protein
VEVDPRPPQWGVARDRNFLGLIVKIENNSLFSIKKIDFILVNRIIL